MNEPRYEYRALASLDGVPLYVVVDKEAAGLWNAWSFATEQEALAFITDKVVVPFRLKARDT